MKRDPYPRRIICLTEETTEFLYALGEEERIVGISGFTYRPPQARKEKPKVSAFTEADIPKILDLHPGLVIGFSDIQAGIASELIKAGVNVWITNQRSVEEILDTMQQLGAMVGKPEQAAALIEGYRAHLNDIRAKALQLAVRPKVYFEEWGDPLITGIRWVKELIEIAGGDYVFQKHADSSLAKGRILADPDEVIRVNPDIIMASWCGKAVKKEQIVSRPGWSEINAVRDDEIHEIDSTIILQPGPAALTDGVDEIFNIISDWSAPRSTRL
jgi:iron complex transport system substrate-binding protein